MTIDISLPPALLAAYPPICPRCHKRAFKHSDPDYVDCLYCGEIFIGQAMGVPVLEGVHRGVDGRFKHPETRLYSVNTDRERKRRKIGETT